MKIFRKLLLPNKNREGDDQAYDIHRFSEAELSKRLGQYQKQARTWQTVGGKLHIAVQTRRDFFELCKSEANVDKLHQKFPGELKWFADIIDTLRGEDTLYKKEVNA